jgi:hypothetical protein
MIRGLCGVCKAVLRQKADPSIGERDTAAAYNFPASFTFRPHFCLIFSKSKVQNKQLFLIRPYVSTMTTPLKQALIEAAWLLQAFVAALEALRVVAFFEHWHNAYIFVYVLLFPFTSISFSCRSPLVPNSLRLPSLGTFSPSSINHVTDINSTQGFLRSTPHGAHSPLHGLRSTQTFQPI